MNGYFEKTFFAEQVPEFGLVKMCFGAEWIINDLFNDSCLESLETRGHVVHA